MAMTAAVKDELSRLSVTRPCCRKAEISALLRFAGGLHLVGGAEAGGPSSSRPPSRIVVEAELDTGSTARRLRKKRLRKVALGRRTSSANGAGWTGVGVTGADVVALFIADARVEIDIENINC